VTVLIRLVQCIAVQRFGQGTVTQRAGGKGQHGHSKCERGKFYRLAGDFCLEPPPHRRKLLLGPGAQAPLTFMIMGLAYMTSPTFLLRDIVYIVFQLFAMVLRNADKSTVRPFIPCSPRHSWKGAKFAGSVGHPMTKMLSASGGLRPLTPTRGSAPCTPLGALPPYPHYSLVLRTRHGAPQPLTPSTACDPRASSPPTCFDKFTLMPLPTSHASSPASIFD